MLNLHQLQIFHTAAESSTLTEAAEKLYLTQPAVSQQIRNLETHLGTRLFERSRRGIELTPAGRELFTYTLQILRLVAQAEASLTNINNIKEARAVVGATPNVGSYLLPQWVQTFRLQHPNITLIIQTGTTPDIIEAVTSGEQSLGFVEGEITNQEHQQINFTVLEPLPHRVVIGRDHAWWGRKSINIEELDGQPFIIRQKRSQSHAWLEEIFKRYSVSPRIVGEFDNPESLKQTVRNSVSITVLPLRAVEHDVDTGLLAALDVNNADLTRSLRLIWQKDSIFSAVTRAMIAYLIESYPHVNELLAKQ